jgi:hypothetical protein
MNRERELRPELRELLEALRKLRSGRPSDIDVIRMLELYEWFHETRQNYWAAMAAAIATQAIAPDW